jgi:hypothetical protein
MKENTSRENRLRKNEIEILWHHAYDGNKTDGENCLPIPSNERLTLQIKHLIDDCGVDITIIKLLSHDRHFVCVKALF